MNTREHDRRSRIFVRILQCYSYATTHYSRIVDEYEDSFAELGDSVMRALHHILIYSYAKKLQLVQIHYIWVKTFKAGCRLSPYVMTNVFCRCYTVSFTLVVVYVLFQTIIYLLFQKSSQPPQPFGQTNTLTYDISKYNF